MWYRGIVMNIAPNCVVILTDTGEFLKIKKQPDIKVGQTILCLEEDLIKEQRKLLHFLPQVYVTFIGLVAACLLVFLFPQSETYAVLSLDINPSFELKLDENQQIIGIHAFNDEAERLQFTDLKGLELQKGLMEIRKRLTEAGYLLDQQSMIYSLAFMKSDNITYENQVKNQLKDTPITTEFGYLKVTSEELKEAHHKQLSGARLKADEMLDSIDITQLSVNEIIQLFQENQIEFDMLCHDGEEIEMKKDCCR